MKNKNWILNGISNYTLLLLIFLLTCLKISIFILIKSEFFKVDSGGSDAEYYHAYAIGYIDKAVNIWPIILNNLYNLGLYDRVGISIFLFFLSLIVIPFFIAKLADLSFKHNQKFFLYILLLCVAYPTLFYYTLDVYRDVFMVFSFLVGCLIVKKSLNNSNFFYFCFLYLLAIILGLFLLGLRPYLGYAFLLALFLWKIKFTKKRIIFLSVVYFLTLFIANYIGLLSTLTEYRSGFEDGGGSTLGLNFSNPIMFFPNFILSTLGQLFGLYITNPFAIILLLFETLPFVFMLVYVIKNIKLADNFIRFLIIFFVLYASVWLIGNDNLGTAVRLRMYNYLAIYICFFYILRLRHLSSILPQDLKK